MSSALGIYEDDVFKMACEQFRVIANYLEIPESHRQRLMMPKRAIAVTLPVWSARWRLQPECGIAIWPHFFL